MKFRLPAKELKYALTGLGRVVSRKSTLPILATVRIESGQDTVTISATDLDSHLRYTCLSAEVLEAGEPVIVDHKRLKDLVAKATRDEIVIESVGSSALKVGLHGPLGDREQVLPSFDPADWPSDPPAVSVDPVEEDFLGTYRRLIPFASRDETRAILNGVLIETGKDGHLVVTTDGRRLTRVNSLSLPIGSTCVLPTHRFLEKGPLNGDCRVGVSEDAQQFRLESGPWSFQCRTLEGAFPNWRQVIPPESDGPFFEIVAEDIPVTEDAISTLPGNGSEPTMVIRSDEEHVLLAAHDSETDTWSFRRLPNSRWEGKSGGTAIDRNYFRQALDAGFRRFHVSDPLSPLRADDGNGGLHVLMPMRTEIPDAPNGIPKKKEKTKMIEKTRTADTPPNGSDQLWLSFQEVREKARELNTALNVLGRQIKEARKQDRTVKTELENARGVLQKLKNVKL